MPIPFALLIAFVLGATFAWIAGPDLARGDDPIVLSRPFAAVAAFTLLVWFPVVGYFVAFHGDWSYLYLLPSSRVPSAIDLILVIAACAAVCGGFVTASKPARKRSLGPVIAAITAPAALAVAGLAIAARRLEVSGTYAQFHGDFGTQPIGSSLLGKGVLFMGAVTAAGVAWTAWSLTRGVSDRG